MKVKHLLPLFLLLPLACRQEKPAYIVPVKSAGTLKQIMQDGDISAKIDLATLAGRPQLYGIGAAEDLQGEIMIWQGKAFLTTVAGSGLATYDGFRKRASLLVYSEVSVWDSLPLPPEINQLDQLEAFLVQTAEELGLDASHPFPFLLKGRPEMVSWHVIDWDVEDPVHTHSKHQQSGMRSGWKNTPTEVIGFYSPTPGVFTHHDSRIHLHATTPDRRLVAHLDQVTGISGMHLYLPAMEGLAQ